ncbi:MAG: ATP-binding protein [Deltaproteobacteria bacterium]|nr:ATP-binding protein [Deltaproteobacteria bacterium]
MGGRIQKYDRILKIAATPNPLTGSGAAFLWGPRQTGKTTFLKQTYPQATYYDLLDTELNAELSIRPSLLREEILAEKPALVIVDEVQKVPQILEEIHWLLENTSTQFILCGSSARKLKRGASNLLGGRAVEFHLLPLISPEIPDLDIDKLLNHGGLPAHYLLEKPEALLRSYVNTYIKEEIIDESLTRNIPSFSRFLQIVGLTHGRQLNYANVGRESGVSSNTVRNYYQILKDTLLGFELPPWRKKKKRRLVETAKFFLFDIGVANYLNPDSRLVVAGSDTYGRAFEHFVINEIRAYLSYNHIEVPLNYWRTASGFEVDVIAGDMNLALEIKSTTEIRSGDLKGLRALAEEHAVDKSIVVSRNKKHRLTEDGIEMLHWSEFCFRLWQGDLIQ